MLGLFSRRPRPDAEAVARLKRWVSAMMGLDERDHVSVAEIACHEPGCPDRETVVTADLADRRRFVLRFPGAVGEVTEAQVLSLRGKVPVVSRE
jgi:hypothetical protein